MDYCHLHNVVEPDKVLAEKRFGYYRQTDTPSQVLEKLVR